MDLRRQLSILRAWFPLLAFSVLAGAGAAALATNTMTPLFEARTTVIVGQSLSASNPDYSQLLASQRLSSTYAKVATTRPVLSKVIAELDLEETPNQLVTHVRADALLDSSLLTITAQHRNPVTAAAIANAVADQLIAASPGLQGTEAALQESVDAQLLATLRQMESTQAEVERLAALPDRSAAEEGSLSTLQGRLTSLGSTYAALLSFLSTNASNQLAVVEPAIASDTPISPRPLLNVLLGAILGLLIGASIVFVAEYLDDTLKSADDVRDVVGLATLGAIPRMRVRAGMNKFYMLVSLLYPRSAASEAFRTLRANIEFASVDSPIRTLLVTSAVQGEGKTITAANLAIVFAQAGRSVLLVDADLRKPGIHSIFDLSNHEGLTSLLRSDGETVDSVSHATEQQNLRVLTSGPRPPNPAELLDSQRMRTLLDTFTTRFDLVIVDGPPTHVVIDSAILGSMVGGTLFVVGYSGTRRGIVRQGREALAKAGAGVIGAVLNRIPDTARSDYGDYYAAGTPDRSAPASEPSA